MSKRQHGSTLAQTQPLKKPRKDQVVHPLLSPNCTIYVRNINDKVSNETAKKGLYVLFSTYCDVLQIYYTNTGRLRGQAWLVVGSIEEAELALIRLRGITVFGKSLQMEFSKNTSKLVSRLEGVSV